MQKQKLTYIFIDPNTKEETEKVIREMMIERITADMVNKYNELPAHT